MLLMHTCAALWTILACAASLGSRQSARTKLEVFDGHRVLALTDQAQDRIQTQALAVLASASYEAGPDVRAEAQWAEVAAGPHLRIQFSPARRITLSASHAGPIHLKSLQVEEILIPFQPPR